MTVSKTMDPKVAIFSRAMGVCKTFYSNTNRRRSPRLTVKKRLNYAEQLSNLDNL